MTETNLTEATQDQAQDQAVEVSSANIPEEVAAAIEADAEQIAQEAREKGYDPEQYAQWVQEAANAGVDVHTYIEQQTQATAEVEATEANDEDDEDNEDDEDDDF